MKAQRFILLGCLAVWVILLNCTSKLQVDCLSAPSASSTLTLLQVQKLNEYAQATVRYFTGDKANNKEVGFTHAFFGTGKFQVYKDGEWQEEDWDLTRGYGSHVNINEVTLRFLSLAAAYKMRWLGYLPPDDRYAESWGQILTGLQTLRTMQTSGDHRQFYEGHFHRNYLTTITRDGQYDVDRHVDEIVCPEGEDIQSSDDNALPFMNLLELEGLASDPAVDIPDRTEIISLCREIREAIDLQGFIVDGAIAHAIENGVPTSVVWDRVSAEGAIILAALLLSDQITEEQFEQLSSSLENYPVDWNSFDHGVIEIGKPSYHAAMFIHGLRAIHGMPVTAEEFTGLNYFTTSTEPVLEAQMDFAQHYGHEALSSQVMTQELYGTPLYEINGKQVQFPGNEDNKMPVPGSSLSRATGPHAWFVPLQRRHYVDQEDIDRIFDWAASYESEFFHLGSDIQLGWEAAIPWTLNDTTYAWQASDGTWRYTDWGRPYEALNAAYIILSIFDALNQDAPLASYNVEAERLKRIAFYFDNGRWPSPMDTEAVFRVTREGNVYADRAYYGADFLTGGADIAEYISVGELVEPGDVVELDPQNPGYYRKSRGCYSTLVAGVISTAPGMTMGGAERERPLRDLRLSLGLNDLIAPEHFPIGVSSLADNAFISQEITLQWSIGEVLTQLETNRPLLALMGIVPVKVTTENGPIQPGDLLTTSSTPGHAMRCDDIVKCESAIIGKALEPLERGTGIIKMLVMR